MKFLSNIKRLFSPSNNYSMRILIENSGFTNRGDQLMIKAVMEQLSQRMPNAQLLVKKDVFLQNPTYCIAHHLYPLTLSKSKIKQSRIYKKIVNTLLGDDWMVTSGDVDVILDCRGYHVADWRINNQEYVEYLKSFYSSFTKKSKKYIMLPQAFGPFHNTYSQQVAQMLHEQADYIYAREPESYGYLKTLFPSSKKIGIAPDFTCLTTPQLGQSILLPKQNFVLIIPNAKMIEKANTTSQYLTFMTEIAKDLMEKGEKVYLLNHEGSKDEDLCRLVNENLGNSLPILTNLSGVDIKAIIKDCKLLICGRYHGVVSGLTQGVPTLCTAWSHKYVELLKEHDCINNILDVLNIPDAKQKIQDALHFPQTYISNPECERKIEEQVNAMWENIVNILYPGKL